MILGFIDSKWRDTKGMVLLRNELKKRNIEMILTSFNNWQPAIRTRPHVVILNHLKGDRNKEIARYVKSYGGKVAVLPTEGRPNSTDLAQWMYDSDNYDLWLDWNNIYEDLLDDNLKDKHITVGSPRFDVYDSGWHKTRDEITGLYNINAKKIALICSSFPQAKFSKVGSQFNQKDWKDLGRGEALVNVIDETKAFRVFYHTMKVLVNTHDDWHFIVKPHPMESGWMWESFCEQSANTTLITQSPIEDIVPNVDKLINRVGCITSYDAYFGRLDPNAIMSTNFEQRALSGAERDASESLRTYRTPALFLDGFDEDIKGKNYFGAVANQHIRFHGESAELAAYRLASLHREANVASATFKEILALQESRRSINHQHAYPSLDGLHVGKTVTDGYILSMIMESRNETSN